MHDEARKYIIESIRDRAIYKPKNNKYMFGKIPGTRYSWQFYMANCLYDPKFMEAVAHCFYHSHLNKIDGIQIAGREWSAIPIISSLQIIGKGLYGKDVNAFMIRRERKNYGRHNFIEGRPNDKEVLIVDDLCNSTNSFYHCRNVCDATGLTCFNQDFAIVNKHSRKQYGNDILFDKYSQVPVETICEWDDLI